MALFNKVACGSTRKQVILQCCFQKVHAFKNDTILGKPDIAR